MVFNKVLVTGASGFVGSNLVKFLVSKGQDVHIILRQSSSIRSLSSIKEELTIHRHDGSMENMLEIVKLIKPEIVYHLASLVLAQHETKDITPLITSNILFGTQLVEAMVINKVYHLINTGTSWQHFENREYDPVCLNAATKQAFEDILTYYVKTSPLKVINLKLFDTYGPGDTRKKLFYYLHQAINNGEILDLSPGQQLIDLVYIDDVVNAFLLAAEHIKKEEIRWESYAVSSQNPIMLKDLVQIYENVIGKKIPIRWGGRTYREREVMVPWNKGTLVPGWEPRIDLLEGIKRISASLGSELLNSTETVKSLSK